MHDYFETADVSLGAVIMATVGAPLIGVDKSDPQRPKLQFHREEVPNELIEAYWRGNVRVDPAVFSMVQRFLAFKIQEKT